ncbi:unnamed protein product [Dracunculus medinensis]|uniref:GATOR complex protein NPRL3 n=1 Tax=Dracunculus medinensis TaxID=318479 RepID=A0A158Q4A9_DRAME|nr:unnamed protein product [Dracunculus medinensis]
MGDERYMNAPLGVLFVTMGANHEQISFSYPFSSNYIMTFDKECSPEQFVATTAVPVQILAYLLSAKGTCEKFFELKIDNIRFAGFPKIVSKPTGRSPQAFNIVFVLIANASVYLVQSFQLLSKKLAIALDEEQSRCGYLAEQMTSMLNDCDKTDSSIEGESLPYADILTRSQLAQDLKDLFTDISEFGIGHIFINDCVEVGFCIETRALIQAGLTPKSRMEIEKIVKRIRPYHGIILLGNTIPSPDANPSVRLFLKHCDPDRSIVGISDASGLPLVQVLLIVRHLLLWARAIIIYPLCSSNVYSSAAYHKPIVRLSEQFSELFENAQLPVILAQFSPPCTLAEFVNASFHSSEEQQIRVNMVIRLLRDSLIMQLHTFIYLLPSFSSSSVDELEIEALREENIRDLIISSKFSMDIKATLARLCLSLLRNSSSEQVANMLSLFIRLSPYLNGNHHVEDIMYRMNLDRSTVVRILDTFSCVLICYSRPEFPRD